MATRDYDSVEFLTDETEIAAYLKAAAEHNNDAFYTRCLAQVARARAINQLAESAGVDRDMIFEILSEPKNIVWLRTYLAVMPTEIAEARQLAHQT